MRCFDLWGAAVRRPLAFAFLFIAVACKRPAPVSADATAATAGPAADSALALSDDASDGAEDSGSLRFATGSGYPPFSDVGLPGGGIATELVETIFSNAQLP